MSSTERRLYRLENPSRGPMEGLAEALDHWRLIPGQPPRVHTPEDLARRAEHLRELEEREAAGKKLSRCEEFMLSTLRYQAAGGVS